MSATVEVTTRGNGSDVLLSVHVIVAVEPETSKSTALVVDALTKTRWYTRVLPIATICDML